MPHYDYDCSACGTRFEVMHGVHAAGPAACPNCGSDRVRKAFAAPAVHFKGSGWAKKERRATSTPGASRAASDGGEAGTTGSDTGSAGDGAGASDTAPAAKDRTAGAGAKPAKGASTAAASAGSGAGSD